MNHVASTNSMWIKFAKNDKLTQFWFLNPLISHLKEIEWKKHSILVIQKVKIYLDIFAHFKKAEEKKKLLRSNIFFKKRSSVSNISLIAPFSLQKRGRLLLSEANAKRIKNLDAVA